MKSVSWEVLEQVTRLLGDENLGEEVVEAKVRQLVNDDLLARRLIDWIPEAYGLVSARMLSDKIVISKTFRAQAADGMWHEFPFRLEPIYGLATKLATRMFEEGPRRIVQNVAMRSSSMNAINNGLKAGESIDGGVLSGPALIGIPAEIYFAEQSRPLQIIRSLFQRLTT